MKTLRHLAWLVVLAFCGPARADITTGLVGHWTLDESSGTYADSSGNGNTATAVNSPTRSAGYRSRGVTLAAASSQYLTVPSSTSINSITTAFTLAAWVYYTPSSGTRAIISRQSTGFGEQYYFGFDNNQIVLYSNYTTSRTFGWSNFTGWNHFAVTYNGSLLKFYVNGAQVASYAQTGTITTFNNPVCIGCNVDDSTASNLFSGRLDEVRMYNRALDASDIAELSEGRLQGQVKFWTATGSTSYTTAANWSLLGDTSVATTVPTHQDRIVFAALGTSNCSIPAGTTVGGIDVQALHTSGLVSPAGALDIAGNLTIAGGASPSFSGGSGAIYVGGNLNMSGGSLTATSGTMRINGALNQTAGTLTHSSGTLQVESGDAYTQRLSGTANALTFGGSGGLVYHWVFEEGTGTSVSDKAGSNTGTLVNSAAFSEAQASPSMWSGGNRYSLSLTSASSQYMSTATSLEGVLGGTASLAAWIRTTQVGSSAPWSAPGIAGVEDNTGGNDIFWGSLTDTGRMRLRVGDSGQIDSTTAVNDGYWHHVAITRDSSTGAAAIYIDGLLQTSNTNIGTGSKTTAFNSIGRVHNSSSQYLNGDLDDVRVYNRVITAAEVAALAAGFPVSGGGKTQTLGSNVTTAGNVTVSSGTLAASSYSMTVGGSWSATGGTFTPGTSTVTFNGSTTGRTLTSAGSSFYNLRMNGSSGSITASDALNVDNTLQVSAGTLSLSSHICKVEGSVTVDGGTLTASSNRLEIGGSLTRSSGTFTHNSGSVLMRAGSAASVSGVTLNNVTLNDGLVGYWKLDETTTTSAGDSSGYGNNATSSGSGITSTTTKATLHYYNERGFQFTGSGSMVASANTAAIPAPNAAQTVSLWFYYTAVPTDTRSLYTAWDGSSQALQISFADYSGMKLAARKYGGGLLVSASTPSTSAWHHVAYVHDGSNNHTLYVDGVATSATATPNTGALTSVNIGATSGGYESFSGIIDDVRLYKRALSADEVRLLATGAAPATNQATYTIASGVTVSGDFQLASGTADLSAGGLSVSGSFINHGGRVSMGTQTLTLAGSSSSKIIALNGVRLPNLSITGIGSWTLHDPLEVSGTLSMSAASTLATQSYMVRAGGFSQTAGTFTPSSGTVVVTGSSSANTTLRTSATLNNVRIENTRPANLTGYWKMDEGTGGTMVDWTDGGNTATRVGGRWTTEVPSTITFGNRFAFDTNAGTGYVTLPHAAGASTTALTVSLWARATGNGAGTSCGAMTDGTLFFKGNTRGAAGNYEGLMIKDLPSWGLQVAACNSTATDCDYITETMDFAASTSWHHIAVTFDVNGGSNNLKLYRNGTVTAQDTHVSALDLDPSRPFFVGRTGQCGGTGNNTLDGYFQGYIDDVRIYSRALDANEVAALAAGRYPGGTTTYDVALAGTGLTAANAFAIDSGTLDTSTVPLTVSLTGSAALVNAGVLKVGTGGAAFAGGLNVRRYGTLNFPGTGTVSIGSGRTLTIDGTLSDTATSTSTIRSSSGNYAFTVNSDSSNPTATLNVDGMNIQNTDSNGLNIQKATSTTITKFQNVAFSSGTGARYLYINGDSLNYAFPGVTFDVGAASAQTTANVVAAGSGSRFYFENRGNSTSGLGSGETRDSDDDANTDGIADGTGAVVQWLWAAKPDLGGTIVGFPTAALDWNDFSYYSTYVAMKDVDSNGTDRIYVRNANGDAVSSWDLPSGVGDIVGTPRWDTHSSTRYVWVGTSSGRVYKLTDTNGTLAVVSGWPYNQGTNATVTTPLLVTSGNVFWIGNNTSSNPTFFSITQAGALAGTATMTGSVTAALTLVPGSPAYAFAATSGRFYRINTSTPAITTDNTSLNPAAIVGNLVSYGTRLYAVDAAGQLRVVSTSNFSSHWSYQDTASHSGSCTAGGDCEARNLYIGADGAFLANGASGVRVTYGDKDGHLYLVYNSTGSTGAAFSGYPYRAASDTAAITEAPLYNAGIIVYGNSSGNVYVVNALSASTGTPSLLQTYRFGSAVSSIARDRSTNSMAGAYLVATQNGRLYYINTSSDPDAHR